MRIFPFIFNLCEGLAELCDVQNLRELLNPAPALVMNEYFVPVER
jgi:hypothetical protein